MKILAVDSTAHTATVALCEDEKLIALFSQNTKYTHSEILLAMVNSLLAESAFTIADMDAFAVAVGPGSFTGVRIGVSLCKGLAFGTNKPCIPVSTIEALAYNLSGTEGIICPVMDARRNQFYSGIFRGTEKNIIRLNEDCAISAEQLYEKLSKYSDESIYFVGDGYALAHTMISLPNIKTTSEILRYQNAASVAFCAYNIYTRSADKTQFTDSALAATYLRQSQAERERRKTED